jgi:HEAT repeat protein
MDKKKIVRKTAAWALGMIGDERAIVWLDRMLSDEDQEVRDEAKKALDSIQKEKTRKNTDSEIKA